MPGLGLGLVGTVGVWRMRDGETVQSVGEVREARHVPNQIVPPSSDDIPADETGAHHGEGQVRSFETDSVETPNSQQHAVQIVKFVSKRISHVTNPKARFR